MTASGRLPARMGAITAATERSLWPSLRHLQVAQHPLQSFLVNVMVLLPSAEVTDVAVVAQLAGPCLGRLDHGIIEADREQDELLAGALLGKGFGHLVLDPVAPD